MWTPSGDDVYWPLAEPSGTECYFETGSARHRLPLLVSQYVKRTNRRPDMLRVPVFRAELGIACAAGSGIELQRPPELARRVVGILGRRSGRPTSDTRRKLP